MANLKCEDLYVCEYNRGALVCNETIARELDQVGPCHIVSDGNIVAFYAGDVCWVTDVCNEEKLKSILGFILTERVVPLFCSVSVQENLNTFLEYVEKLFA